MNKLLGLIILLSLTACVSTRVDEPNDAYINAVENTIEGNAEEAVRLSIECARQGHGGCAEIVGNYYLSGELLPLNFDKAEAWFLVAADTEVDYLFAGVSGAMNLAEMYCELSYFEEKSGLVGQLVDRSATLLSEVRRITRNDEVHAQVDSSVSDWIDEVRKKSQEGLCKNNKQRLDDGFE